MNTHNAVSNALSVFFSAMLTAYGAAWCARGLVVEGAVTRQAQAAFALQHVAEHMMVP